MLRLGMRGACGVTPRQMAGMVVGVRHASKATGTAAANQASSPRRKVVQFQWHLGLPIGRNQLLKTQRCQYDHHHPYVREPAYHAGRYVKMHERKYHLTAVESGVMTIRKSKINSSYKWVDIEPDIQKVFRSAQIRKALGPNSVTNMTASNSNFVQELQDFEEPQWRERVQHVPTPAERFVDPNLFTKGIKKDIDPIANRYSYE